MKVSAREKLLSLLASDLGKSPSFDQFRVEWERIFNFELPRSEVPERELEIFQRVFDAVVWYSPFPEERESIPNYKGEEEIFSIVEQARKDLGISA